MYHSQPLPPECFKDDKYPLSWEPTPEVMKDPDFFKTPRDVIKGLLASRNEPQTALCEPTGICESTLVKRMKDPGSFKPEEVKGLCSHFGCSVQELRGTWDGIPSDRILLMAWHELDDKRKRAAWLMIDDSRVACDMRKLRYADDHDAPGGVYDIRPFGEP